MSCRIERKNGKWFTLPNLFAYVYLLLHGRRQSAEWVAFNLYAERIKIPYDKKPFNRSEN